MDVHHHLTSPSSRSSSSSIPFPPPVENHNDMVKELQREITVVLANRNKRLGWRRIVLDPIILPYYHFLMAILCMIIMSASSWTFGIWQNNPNYVIPAFLIESNLMAASKSHTFIFLDVAFAAIGLPLLCDLAMDIVGYFWVEINDEQEKLKFETVAEKAKEWCLRLQFICAFAITSMVRVFGPSDDRKIVLVYLTQFLRTIVMVLFGMFSYTDTFDHTFWEYVRSFGIAFGMTFSQLLVYFTGIHEQTPIINALYETGKIGCCCFSIFLVSLFLYRLYLLFQCVMKPGGWSNVSTKEMCFMVYGTLVTIGTIMIGVNLSTCNFDLYRSTLFMYVCHAVMMLIHSVASTSLPVRIARYDVRRANGLIRCTQRKVSNTIDSPLRYLMTEMDCLLHSVNFYQNLTPEELESLERIVALCNDVSVSLEEIVETDLSITSSSSGDHYHHHREEHPNGSIRNRFKSSPNREQMRVSFDLSVLEGDHDQHHSSENTSNKGSAMSGSVMGESILISSVSQPDGDIESLPNGMTSPYPLNRRTRAMLDSLSKNKHLHGECNIRKDQELERHPETEAQFDRLAATLRCREQPLLPEQPDINRLVDDVSRIPTTTYDEKEIMAVLP